MPKGFEEENEWEEVDREEVMQRLQRDTDAKHVDPLIMHDRCTATVSLVHETHGDTPEACQMVYSGMLDEQGGEVWRRRLKVTEQGTPIDLGWLKDKPTGWFMFMFRTPSPSKSTREAVDKMNSRCIRILIEERDTGLYIKANGFFVGCCSDLSGYSFVSSSGDAQLNIYVQPA